MAGTLQSSGSLSVAVAVSRVLGLVRESLKARLIGAGALADTYAVAFRIPNLLRGLLAEGARARAVGPPVPASRVQREALMLTAICGKEWGAGLAGDLRRLLWVAAQVRERFSRII